jgi:hypothetical protein
VANHIQDA